MSPRGFSLRRLRMPWGAKKESTETKTPEVRDGRFTPCDLSDVSDVYMNSEFA